MRRRSAFCHPSAVEKISLESHPRGVCCLAFVYVDLVVPRLQLRWGPGVARGSSVAHALVQIVGYHALPTPSPLPPPRLWASQPLHRELSIPSGRTK